MAGPDILAEQSREQETLHRHGEVAREVAAVAARVGASISLAVAGKRNECPLVYVRAGWAYPWTPKVRASSTTATFSNSPRLTIGLDLPVLCSRRALMTFGSRGSAVTRNERMKFWSPFIRLDPADVAREMAATFQGVSRGRLFINIVSGDAKCSALTA